MYISYVFSVKSLFIVQKEICFFPVIKNHQFNVDEYFIKCGYVDIVATET